MDLKLAHRALEQLAACDQWVEISETLRHLHADRRGNSHRSEISLDKFWNPAWTAGCQGLLEFRALESLPHHHWTAAVALLPSQLWADLERVLAELASDGLPLEAEPFRAIWNWRFPALLDWHEDGASLVIRQALEPWPLLCDTPEEGGTTSRFVDSSLRRFEVVANPVLRQRYTLRLQGRPLPLPSEPGPEQPVAVRYRQDALFPCSSI